MNTAVFPRMADKLPAGVSGEARVEHFEIGDMEVMQAWMANRDGGGAYPLVLTKGRHARLWVGEEMMMSDAESERVTCLPLIEHARGDVLIAGLGLGMVLWPLVRKRSVRSVTVLERYPSVVALVGPHVPRSRKLTIETVDVFDFEPMGQRFDTIFFDIWPTVSVKNLIDMARLHQRYAPHLAPGGWMESWARDSCETMAKQELEDDAYKALMGVCANPQRVTFTKRERRLARKLGIHD
jgi:spermidine synthase